MPDNKVRKKIRSIGKGINTYTANYDLPDNELEIIENWDINEPGYSGVLKKRNGYDRISANQLASGGSGVGSMHECNLTLSGTATDCLLANIINGSSSALYREESPYTGAWTTAKTDAMLAYKLQYASFKDRVYIANCTGGTTANQFYDGTNFLEMGCKPLNPFGITLTASAGGSLSTGTYYYLFTFLYDGDQESYPLTSRDFATSNAYAPLVATTANDKVTLANIPVGSARVTGRKIYRSKVSAPTQYYLLTTIGDNTTTSFVDTTADTGLSEAVNPSLLTGNLHFPYYSKYTVLHKDRQVIANLKNSIYDPIASGEIAIADSGTGGSLVGSTTYKWRFFKAWVINIGTSGAEQMVYGEYVEKTHTTGVGVTSVDITYSGTPDWFGVIAYQRTSGGGSDFEFVGNIGAVGRTTTAFTAGVNDGISDALRLARSAYPSTFKDSVDSYPHLLKISDAGKPDLFSNIETAQDGTLIPASNEWNIGEPITGIWSEENRIIIFSDKNIYQLDTTSQSRQFWRLDKIVSETGAKAGLQCQTPEGYFFLQDTISGVGTNILQYNRGQVINIGNFLKRYCLNNSITAYNDIKYYDTKREVWVIAENSSSTFILKYNIDTGQWQSDVNETDLNFNVLCPTRSKGMILGGGDGYAHVQTSNVYQDKIAGTLTSYTTKAKTKHFNEEDADISPRRFIAVLQVTGSSTSTADIYYANEDGTEYNTTLEISPGTQTIPTGAGVHRLRTATFNSNVVAPKKDIYFEFRTTNSRFEVLKNMTIELEVKHEAGGGK